jgi:PAS domain S-box-containing protein
MSASTASAFAPPANWHDQDHESHVVQFYAKDASLLNALSRFVGSALGAGDAAIVIATETHRDGLAQRLKALGLDTATAIEQGRFVLLDASETLESFLLDGWPDAARFADLVGGIVGRAKEAAGGKNARVAAFGEMVALLWAKGRSKAAIRLEQLWNELAQVQSFSLRCAYPLSGFHRETHGETFLEICAEHSAVIPSESYTALINEEERLRHITLLQQRSLALETATVERTEVEKCLRRRESELAEILENAMEGVQQVGPDRRVLWANKALLKLLGYTAEEYIGHELAEFHVHQHGLDEFWEKLMRHEDIYDYPAEIRCKDGSVKHVEIRSNGLWEDGRFVHTRCFIHDITEHKQMEQVLRLAHDELEKRVNERTVELQQKNQGLRNLSARLLQVQDEERRHIARDLHDSTGQALALLSMQLSALEREAGKFNEGLARDISENREIARQISADLRTISYLLHPPLLDEMGLESALRWYIDGFGQRSKIKVSLELAGNLERLSRDLELAIFRVVQECLTNIHRHSESPTAQIRLHQSSERVTLEVTDGGKGIAPEKLSKIASSGAPGVGLRGMQERIKDFGGEIEIVSLTKGTQIRAIVPLASNAAQSQFSDAPNTQAS